MRTPPRILLDALLGTVACATLLGCKSPDKPASASFASVQISGHTPQEIRAATLSVFQQDGFMPVGVEGFDLVFEKEGSKWDRIAYGNWLDDNAVWLRVRVSLVPASPGAYRLQCQAFKVRDKGDKVFEEEVRLRSNHSKPYQALLDKVMGRLGQ